MIEFELPEFYLVNEDYSENVIVSFKSAPGGLYTPEMNAARSAALKAYWDNNPERKAEMAPLMRAVNIGNQNKTGKPGRNKYTKDKK